MIWANRARWAAALALLAAVLSAPSARPAAVEDVGARLDRYLAAATARLDFTGTVLIVRDGRVLLRRGYGFADPARGTPNRPSTRFRISSLTSDITLLALLQLVDRGRLQLDDSVCRHLRGCPAGWRPITIRLVATGRSGLPSARPLPRTTLALADWMTLLRSRPLAFPAGRGRDRSEARLLVATQIVESVSGLPWQHYVERHVLGPAGMQATTVDRPDLARRARPTIRRRDGTPGPPASFPPLSEPDALYGLASTVDDMYRFDVARRSGRLVSRRLLREIGEASSLRDWPDAYAHLGHGPRGTSDGWYTAFARDPRQRLTILAFSNMGGYSLSDIVHGIALIVSGWPPPRVAADPLVSSATRARTPAGTPPSAGGS